MFMDESLLRKVVRYDNNKFENLNFFLAFIFTD